MKHLMIDIETTGKHPGCRVLSIGACILHGHSSMIDTEVFYSNIKAKSYVADLGEDYHLGNFHDCDDTMSWWALQDDDVRKEAFSGDVVWTDALVSLKSYISHHNPDKVWANAPLFDIAILEFLIREAGMNVDEFWSYRQVACARTVFAMADVHPKDFNTGSAHNALDDAIAQAQALQVALERIHPEWMT